MGPTATMTVVAVTAGLVAAALVAVGVRGPRPSGASRAGLGVVIRPLLGAGVVLAAGAVIVLARGVDLRFLALAHVAYLGIVVALPALGLALLVAAAARRVRPAVAAVAVALLVPAPIGWYATHVEPYRLRVDRASIALPAARAGRDPIRVGVLADLQSSTIGAFEERAVSTLLAQRPDVILVAGDLFQGDDAQYRAALPRLHRLLRRLQAPGGVYAVPGDSEVGPVLAELVAGTGVQVLEDRAVMRRIGDRRILIGGNRLRWAPRSGVALRQSLIDADPSVVRILVAHRPDVVLGLPEASAIDLTVAGHTHGGQVAIPGVGPLFTQSKVSRSVAAGGLHRVAGNPIYVSTGVGMVRLQAPQVRLGVRPSVGLIVLR